MNYEDNGGHFPDEASAKAYVQGTVGSNTSTDYHSDRIRALRLLMRDVGQPTSMIDFGCGDGMYLREFSGNADRLVGIDVSRPMIDMAKDNLSDLGFDGRVGGVEALAQIDGQFDMGFAIDVLGYLGDDDIHVFYQEMARLIRPGGHLLVMYGNELFDMFALNAGTVGFFEKHFSLDVAELLSEGAASQYKPANRKNPLSFGAEIAPYGFDEKRQAFSQWHKLPPGLGNRGRDDLSEARMAMRDHSFDPNTLPRTEAWKSIFRCSIFGSLSRRAD